MKRWLYLVLILPGVLHSQTYYSSETKYFDPKEREEIERTIKIGKDTITIITKGIGVTDIQKLVINYFHEGKMDRIGKAMIYECVAAKGPFLYDVGVPLKDKVKEIGVTAVNLIEEDWRFMIFEVE